MTLLYILGFTAHLRTGTNICMQFNTRLLSYLIDISLTVYSSLSHGRHCVIRLTKHLLLLLVHIKSIELAGHGRF